MPYSRLGLAITRKRVPGAVARHRVKRQVRESFRLHQEVLRGFDLIVLARTGLQAHANRHLRASLEWHWRQIEGKRCNDS
jgi:ribonuclease P protein component